MKPLLVSACLLGVKCKYSGGDNLCPAVAALAERFWLIPVCPEQMGGLPTPRPASERSGARGRRCVWQSCCAAKELCSNPAVPPAAAGRSTTAASPEP